MNVVYLVSMHCASCKSIVENALKKEKGINSFDVNLINNTVNVDFDESIIKEDYIKKIIENNGFRVTKFNEEDSVLRTKNDNKKNIIKLIIGFIVLIPLMFLSMSSMYSSLFNEAFKTTYIYLNGYIELFLTLIILVLFFNFYSSGFKALIKGHPDMNSLVFLSTLASILYSLYLTIIITIYPKNYNFNHIHYYYDGACMVFVIVSLGKLIEALSKRKATSAINDLLKLRPKITHCIRDNKVYDIETKYIQKGDEILVKIGENIPLDGIIIKGKSYIDESMLTGENIPVSKEEDDEVFAGTLNKDGVLNIIVTKDNNNSTIKKIYDLVLKASNMKTTLTKTVDKVASIFVPIILGLAVLTFIIWIIIGITVLNGVPLISHHINVFEEAISFAISVLTISCPCALGLATPISLVVGSSVFSSHGILVNDNAAIEKMNKIDAIVLDKTNTITTGNLKVTRCLEFKAVNSYKDLIYTLEKASNHPFSSAICNYFKDSKILENVNDIELLPGYGIKGKLNNETYYVGSLKLVDRVIKDNNLKEENGLTSYFFDDEKIIAKFEFIDDIEADSKEFLNTINNKFKVVSICTGDNKYNALKVGNELNIKNVIADATPKIKEEYIKELHDKNYKVIMVGDGINDSIALNLADVSIGLAKGSDITLSTSDFILMNNKLSSISFIINFSKKIKNNIRFNLFWALIYNLLMIPLAAGVFAPLHVYLEPMYCSMLMVLSSISVCINSLTLLRFKRK